MLALLLLCILLIVALSIGIAIRNYFKTNAEVNEILEDFRHLDDLDR